MMDAFEQGHRLAVWYARKALAFFVLRDCVSALDALAEDVVPGLAVMFGGDHSLEELVMIELPNAQDRLREQRAAPEVRTASSVRFHELRSFLAELEALSARPDYAQARKMVDRLGTPFVVVDREGEATAGGGMGRGAGARSGAHD